MPVINKNDEEFKEWMNRKWGDIELPQEAWDEQYNGWNKQRQLQRKARKRVEERRKKCL